MEFQHEDDRVKHRAKGLLQRPRSLKQAKGLRHQERWTNRGPLLMGPEERYKDHLAGAHAHETVRHSTEQSEWRKHIPLESDPREHERFLHPGRRIEDR